MRWPRSAVDAPPRGDPCDPTGKLEFFDVEPPAEFDPAEALACEPDEAAAALLALHEPGRKTPTCCLAEDQLVQWIARIVERDEQALTALYDATMSRVYGLVLRVVRRPALAEEVVEDTYFQVWRQAVRFDAGRGRALTWVLAMARSRAIDAVRHDARFRYASLDQESALEVEGDEPPTDDLLDAARGHADLHRALMLLNAQPRQLVALAFFRGLSHEEIATQTALPLGTVKSQIRRALVTLRDLLGDGGLRLLAS